MSNKFKICVLLISLFCLSLAPSCGNEEEPVIINVENIKLNETQLILNIGESVELHLDIQPENATDKTVKWETSDPSVATVSNGTVKAVGEGTTTIKVLCGRVSALCNVKVIIPKEKYKYQYVFGYAYSEDLLKFVTPTITLALDGEDPIRYSLADGNNTSAEKGVSFNTVSLSVAPKWATIWWKGDSYQTKPAGTLTVTFERKDVDYSQFEDRWQNYEINLLSEPFVDKSEGGVSLNSHMWFAITIGSKKTLEQAVDEIISSSSKTVTF